jgi:phage major head subunit gpT-like protein
MGVSIADPYLRQSIYVNLDLSFQAGQVATPTWASKVGTKVPSTSRATRHAWLAKVPKLQKYVGEKQVERLSTRDYVITNDKYSLTLEIPEEDLDDDQVGLYGKTAEMMGNQAAKWPDDMLLEAIQKGKTLLAYDGQPFFSTSHPVNTDRPGLGTFSNLLTNKPLNAANFGAVWQAMMGFLGDDGRPLPVMPFMTLVDPSNAIAVRQILNNTVTGVNVTGSPGGAVAVGNVLQGMTDQLVIPELGSEPGVWYMLASLGGLNPFLYQVRKEPTTTPLTSAQSENVAWHDKLIWMIKARGAAGYTFPFLAVRIEPT